MGAVPQVTTVPVLAKIVDSTVPFVQPLISGVQFATGTVPSALGRGDDEIRGRKSWGRNLRDGIVLRGSVPRCFLRWMHRAVVIEVRVARKQRWRFAPTHRFMPLLCGPASALELLPRSQSQAKAQNAKRSDGFFGASSHSEKLYV